MGQRDDWRAQFVMMSRVVLQGSVPVSSMPLGSRPTRYEQRILDHALRGLLAGEGDLLPRLRERRAGAVGGERARVPGLRHGSGGEDGTEGDERRRLGCSHSPVSTSHIPIFQFAIADSKSSSASFLCHARGRASGTYRAGPHGPSS